MTSNETPPDLLNSVDTFAMPNRPLWIAGLITLALIYSYLFLAQPVGNGLVENDGSQVSRGGYIMISLLYPETRLATWIDSGRLPIRLSDRIPIVLGTCAWLALAALVGVRLMKRGYTPDGSLSERLEHLAFAILAGLAILSTLTLLVGLLGGLKALPLTAAIAVLVILVFCVTHQRNGNSADSVATISAVPPQTIEPPRTIIDRLFLIAIVAMTCFAAVVTMLGACLPPSEFDVLEYHLQAPKEFFLQGHIGFVPHNIYANMPLGTEMHSLAVMTLLNQDDAWLGGLIGKSITASISLIGALLLGSFLTRRIGKLFGWCAAGLWLTSPGIAYVAMFGLIDGALATYVCASAIATFYALQAKPSRSAKDGLHAKVLIHWRLAALMSGAAAAAKYPGLVIAVFPVLGFFGWAAWRYRSVLSKRESVLVACTIAMELAVTCGPWYAKNWYVSGNPFYPLVADVFGGKTLSADKIAQWKRAHKATNFTPAVDFGPISNTIAANSMKAALSHAAQPVLTSIFVQPAMIFGLLLCAGPVLLMRKNRDFQLWMAWIAWSCWIGLVWLFATHRIDRFWFPSTGLWAGLASIGFWWVYQSVSRYLSLTIIVLGLGYGCVLNSSPVNTDNRYFVSLDALRNDVGDKVQIPRIFPTTAWVNRHLDYGRVRILLVGEARAFEFLMPIEYSTCFDLNPGEVYLKGKSRTEQIATLKQHGITHILIQWSEINRYRQPNNYGFSEWPQPTDIQQLIDDNIASRVDWGFPPTLAELLEIK